MQKPQIREVTSSELSIDPSIQRPLDSSRVARMARQLELNAIGTLCVSDRGNGELIVIDGFHRKSALDMAGYDNHAVRAEVFSGLSRVDEALLFRIRNETEKVTYLDRFRVRIVENDRLAIDVAELGARHGWDIVGTHPELSVTLFSVQKLESMYKKDAEVAEKALELSTYIWSKRDRDTDRLISIDPESADHRILGGFDKFLHHYWNDLDFVGIAKKLRKSLDDPASLRFRAKGIMDVYHCSMASAIADLITVAYNKSRKADGNKKLADWPRSTT